MSETAILRQNGLRLTDAETRCGDAAVVRTMTGYAVRPMNPLVGGCGGDTRESAIARFRATYPRFTGAIRG